MQNLLTAIALGLAYLVYVKSVAEKYDSWKALLQSFLDELTAISNWVSNEYKENDYDKNFFNPSKRVFRVTTVAAEEIVRRGISDVKVVKEKLRDKLALFIERIAAFNAEMEHNSRLNSSNPILSQNLRDKLKTFGIFDPDVTTTSFEQNFKSDKNFINSKEFLLMQQIFNSNKTIHQVLIADKSQEDRLNFLYTYLKNEVEKVVDNIEEKSILPPYIKYKDLILIMGSILYLVFEYWMK